MAVLLFSTTWAPHVFNDQVDTINNTTNMYSTYTTVFTNSSI